MSAKSRSVSVTEWLVVPVESELQTPYDAAVPYSTADVSGTSVVHLTVAENGPTDETFTPLTTGGFPRRRQRRGGGVVPVVTTSGGAYAPPCSFAVKSTGVVAELVKAKLYVPAPVTSGVTSIDTQVLTANEPADDVTVDEYAGLLFQFSVVSLHVSLGTSRRSWRTNPRSP